MSSAPLIDRRIEPVLRRYLRTFRVVALLGPRQSGKPTLARRVGAAGCPVVILLNKWDLIGTEARLDLGRDVDDRLGFLGDPPVLRVSALSGKGVTRLWPSLSAAVAEYRTRIPTRRVNDAVRPLSLIHL